MNECCGVVPPSDSAPFMCRPHCHVRKDTRRPTSKFEFAFATELWRLRVHAKVIPQAYYKTVTEAVHRWGRNQQNRTRRFASPRAGKHHEANSHTAPSLQPYTAKVADRKDRARSHRNRAHNQAAQPAPILQRARTCATPSLQPNSAELPPYRAKPIRIRQWASG